jgi:Uma2 family endonuclease
MVNDINLFFPDVRVYCGQDLTSETIAKQMLDNPSIIFEVLSPTTLRNDQGNKLDEYRTIAPLETIVCVDPEKELTRVVQRLGPTSWRDDLFAQLHDVALPSIGVTIPHNEIFTRD